MTAFLIADIGGTNVRFAVADENGMHDPQILRVADFPGVLEAASHYLQGKPRPERGVFAVAGPVSGDFFQLTNFPWSFSVAGLSQALGIRIVLINDFHAVALGVPHAQELVQLGGGAPVAGGNIAVIGPGTGLGVGSLTYDSRTGRYIAVAGEGGHVTIPSLTRRETDIRDWLLANKYHHVSAERVCSGKGLLNLHTALRALGGKGGMPDLEPEEITARALAGTCDVCAECLELMLTFLGRVAGNLALTIGAQGGVYFTGGILPRIDMAYLEKSPLRPSFIAKGRQTGYVDRIPTFIVKDPLLGLKGLRQYGMDVVG